MELDQDVCYRAVKGRDRRFDGMFYTAVRTTGIYCRPSCPAITPRRRNVSFYRTAAGAQGAGYRACRRCLPDATPGSPEWDVAADVASRAMRLVADGVVEREGVEGLASALGYSTRQLNRVVTQEYGAGPLALARSRRAQTARVLIETTDLYLRRHRLRGRVRERAAVQRHPPGGVRRQPDPAPRRGRLAAVGAAPSGHHPHPDRRPRAVRRRRPAPLPRDPCRARDRGRRARAGTNAPCGCPHGPGVVRLELADRTDRARCPARSR